MATHAEEKRKTRSLYSLPFANTAGSNTTTYLVRAAVKPSNSPASFSVTLLNEAKSD
jgi:hypothetical protein